MVEVDLDGRVTIPDDIRDQLKMTPGTEVEVRVENGRVIIEPRSGGSTDPIDRMLTDPHGDVARHRENIREGTDDRDR
jgi:AbrB family looped-hinge helix DNA binding protein